MSHKACHSEDLLIFCQTQQVGTVGVQWFDALDASIYFWLQHSHLCFLLEGQGQRVAKACHHFGSFPSRLWDGRGWPGDVAAAAGPGKGTMARHHHGSNFPKRLICLNHFESFWIILNHFESFWIISNMIKHTHIHTYIHTYTHIYIHTYIRIYIYPVSDVYICLIY